MVAEDLGAAYDGDLDNGEWALADLEAISGGTVAHR